MSELERIVDQLRNVNGRAEFDDLPDTKDSYYAVWVDAAGANDLTAESPEPISVGIIYVGECVTQSVRRHLAHNTIGSLTLMKNLAALFRRSWSLQALNRGTKLEEPGSSQLRSWMKDHLTATVADRAPEVTTKRVLSEIDPCLRIEGWLPERTELRVHLTAERAELDRRR